MANNELAKVFPTKLAPEQPEESPAPKKRRGPYKKRISKKAPEVAKEPKKRGRKATWKNPLRSVALKLTVTQPVKEAVGRLLETGFYGRNASEAAERLLSIALEDREKRAKK